MPQLARRIYWIPGCPPTTYSELKLPGRCVRVGFCTRPPMILKAGVAEHRRPG